MGSAMCREFDSHRLHIYLSFSSVRAEDFTNGYFGSLPLSTTAVVSGEGRAPEIPVKKSLMISLRTRQHTWPYPLSY